MSRRLPDIEDLFRNSLGKFKDAPSNDLWKNIEADLNKEDAIRYKRKFTGLKRAAILIGILLLSFAVYEMNFTGTGKVIAAKNTIQDNTAERNEQGKQKTTNTTINSRENDRENNTATDRVAPENETITNNAVTTLQPIQLSRSNIATGKISSPKQSFLSQKTAANASLVLFDYTNTAIGENKSVGIANAVQHTHDPIAFAEKKLNPGSQHPVHIAFSLPFSPADLNLAAQKKRLFFKPGWTLSAITSFDRSKYILDNDMDDRVNPQLDEKTVIAQREDHEPSFSAGILGTYQFKKNWALQTGIIYSYTQIGIHPQKIYAKPDEDGDIYYKYNSSSGYAYIVPGFAPTPALGDSLNATEAKHTLAYLSIPMMVQYKWSGKKISVSPGIGFSLNTLLNARIETEVKDASRRETVTINKIKGLRAMYAGLLFNTDIQYNLNQNWAVNLVPAFKFAATPINKNNVVKTYPYSFGLGAGVSYHF